MRNVVSAAVVIAAMLAGPAFGDQMEDLAKAKQCFSCHQIDKEMIGPSFKAIAKKYKGMANAEIMLAERVKKGGTAHFGTATMPSQAARVELTDAEAKSLVAWILAMK